MLKNKFKIITLLLIIILSISIPISRADNDEIESDLESSQEEENETYESNEDELVAEDNNHSIDSNILEDNFKKNDVFLTGDDVIIDYVIDGNLFVVANTVTIDSQVGGDAFICANKLIIGDEGYIYSNLFTLSKDVEISGVVYDVYALSQNLSVLDGYIYRDLKAACESLNVTGAIGRNVYVDCANLSFGEELDENSSLGSISGDLNYSAEKEFSIPEGVVSGEINFTENVDDADDSESFGVILADHLLSIGSSLATVLVIWLLCLWITPKFLDNTQNLVSKKILPVLGIGLLTPIVAIIAAIILLIVGLTSSIGLLLLGIFVILVVISNSIFTIGINNLLCNKLKIEKKIGICGMLILSTIVIYLVKLIPYLGGLIGFLSVIIGLGMIIYSIPVNFKKDKKVEDDKTVTEIKEDK